MRWAWWIICAALAVGVPGAARGQTMAMGDRTVYSYVSFDEFEYRVGPEERPVELDALAWIGGDLNRLWVKARGERSTRGGAGEVEGQLLYGRVVSSFWDLQAGVRFDMRLGGGTEGRTRGLLVLGLQGLAPPWFEVESMLFVSHEGDVSVRVQASYDLLLTQRLILEPELEFDLAAQDAPEFRVASGLSTVEVGARVRYEIVRELAPYVGVSWERYAGGSDGPERETSLVAGLRWWY
jgi:copper resistance protein B